MGICKLRGMTYTPIYRRFPSRDIWRSAQPGATHSESQDIDFSRATIRRVCLCISRSRNTWRRGINLSAAQSHVLSQITRRNSSTVLLPFLGKEAHSRNFFCNLSRIHQDVSPRNAIKLPLQFGLHFYNNAGWTRIITRIKFCIPKDRIKVVYST